MADAVIGALRVVLGADTAALEEGLKRSQSNLAGFAAQAQKAALIVTGALAGLAGGLTAGIIKSLNAADQLGKTAQKIGIPVEELSKLKHAADLSGVSMESMSTSVGRLSRNMAEAAAGGTSAAARTFKALEIAVKNTDGSLRSSTAVMGDVAARFATMQDGAGKTALAMNLFGRAGADMIPLLNSGRTGLAEMTTEAEKLGLVVTSKTAKAAELFNDNMTRLQRVASGTANLITAELAPSFALLTTKIVEYVKENNVAQSVAQTVVQGLENIARAALTVAHFFQGLARETVKLWDVLNAFFSKSPAEFAAAWKAFREEGDRSEEGLQRIRQTFQDFRTEADALATQMATTAGAIQTNNAPIVASNKSVTDSLKAMKDAARAALDEIVKNPLTPSIEKLNALKAAVDAGTISWKQYGDMVRQVNKEQQTHLTDMASQAASTITAIFGKNKAASIAAAIINTAVAVTKALSAYPPPISFIMAGLQAAAGAGQIAAIKSAKMATGGSFIVPGGSTGFDNKFVSLNLAAGERVDVTPAGQASGGGNASFTPVNVHIQGRDDRDWFARQIDGINSAIADGYRLRVLPA